jgi:hypothetical protein
MQREVERDNNARNMMVLSFTSLVQEFLKKFRKVVAGVKVSFWPRAKTCLHRIRETFSCLSHDLKGETRCGKAGGVAGRPLERSLQCLLWEDIACYRIEESSKIVRRGD